MVLRGLGVGESDRVDMARDGSRADAPGLYEGQVRPVLVLLAAAERVDARQPRRRVPQHVRKQPARAAPLPASQLQRVDRHWRTADGRQGRRRRLRAAVRGGIREPDAAFGHGFSVCLFTLPACGCDRRGLIIAGKATAVEFQKPSELAEDALPVHQVV